MSKKSSHSIECKIMTKDINIGDIIAKRIRKRRAELGISQEELADRADIHRTYAGMVERNEKNISAKTLAKIVKALDMTLEEFFKGL